MGEKTGGGRSCVMRSAGKVWIKARGFSRQAGVNLGNQVGGGLPSCVLFQALMDMEQTLSQNDAGSKTGDEEL